MFTRRIAPALLLALGAAPALAQTDAGDWLARCRRNRWGDGEHACAVKEQTIPARGALRVDGGENGGVTVSGWDRNEIKVVARIEAQARTMDAAETLVDGVEIVTAPGVLARGPETRARESWSVSFDVYVPRHTDLDLETHNGGIRAADVDGAIRFDATNGGVRLAGLSGDVRGATENGGLHVALDGDRWRGAGLDVRTRNGGVTVEIPRGYNAELETGTVNGGFDIGFPMAVSGRLGRSITTRLGAGGPPVRVRTENGGVRVRQR